MMKFVVYSGAVLATVSGAMSAPTPSCTLVETNTPGLTCGSEGLLSTPHLLSEFSSNGDWNTCRQACEADKACLSYSYCAASDKCVLYSSSVVEQSFAASHSGIQFWSKYCYQTKCVVKNTQCAVNPTSTIVDFPTASSTVAPGTSSSASEATISASETVSASSTVYESSSSASGSGSHSTPEPTSTASSSSADASSSTVSETYSASETTSSASRTASESSASSTEVVSSSLVVSSSSVVVSSASSTEVVSSSSAISTSSIAPTSSSASFSAITIISSSSVTPTPTPTLTPSSSVVTSSAAVTSSSSSSETPSATTSSAVASSSATECAAPTYSPAVPVTASGCPQAPATSCSKVTASRGCGSAGSSTHFDMGYSGAGHVLSPTNSANNELHPAQTLSLLGSLTQCQAAEQCATFALNLGENFYEYYLTTDLHYRKSTSSWECVAYFGETSSPQTEVIPDADVCSGYVYDGVYLA